MSIENHQHCKKCGGAARTVINFMCDACWELDVKTRRRTEAEGKDARIKELEGERDAAKAEATKWRIRHNNNINISVKAQLRYHGLEAQRDEALARVKDLETARAVFARMNCPSERDPIERYAWLVERQSREDAYKRVVDEMLAGSSPQQAAEWWRVERSLPAHPAHGRRVADALDALAEEQAE